MFHSYELRLMLVGEWRVCLRVTGWSARWMSRGAMPRRAGASLYDRQMNELSKLESMDEERQGAR